MPLFIYLSFLAGEVRYFFRWPVVSKKTNEEDKFLTFQKEENLFFHCFYLIKSLSVKI